MDRTRFGTLIEYYGELLNDKQLEAISLYYLEDYSLTEIAEQTQTSKQAVSNLIKRAESLLESYEDKLEMIKISEDVSTTIYKVVEELNNNPDNISIVNTLKNLVERV